MIQLCLW